MNSFIVGGTRIIVVLTFLAICAGVFYIRKLYMLVKGELVPKVQTAEEKASEAEAIAFSQLKARKSDWRDHHDWRAHREEI